MPPALPRRLVIVLAVLQQHPLPERMPRFKYGFYSHKKRWKGMQDGGGEKDLAKCKGGSSLVLPLYLSSSPNSKSSLRKSRRTEGRPPVPSKKRIHREEPKAPPRQSSLPYQPRKTKVFSNFLYFFPSVKAGRVGNGGGRRF